MAYFKVREADHRAEERRLQQARRGAQPARRRRSSSGIDEGSSSFDGDYETDSASDIERGGPGRRPSRRLRRTSTTETASESSEVDDDDEGSCSDEWTSLAGAWPTQLRSVKIKINAQSTSDDLRSPGAFLPRGRKLASHPRCRPVEIP